MPTVVLDKWLKHSARPKGTKVSTICLHHTAGASANSTIAYLKSPLVLASYHFVVERDGTVYKCVPVSQKAWHAGISKGPFGSNVNAYSVGIAFANKGNGEPYPEAQVEGALALISELKRNLSDLTYITTHRLITKRKVDPAHFGFESFAQRAGLVAWMDRSLNRPWDG